MTQLARWGIIPFPKNWLDVTERVRRVDVYGQAARELELTDIGRDREPIKMFDGTTFNPDDPLQYLNSVKIKRPTTIEEINIDQLVISK
jgi:nitrate/nitrite transport system ATP-binding protein